MSENKERLAMPTPQEGQLTEMIIRGETELHRAAQKAFDAFDERYDGAPDSGMQWMVEPMEALRKALSIPIYRAQGSELIELFLVLEHNFLKPDRIHYDEFRELMGTFSFPSQNEIREAEGLNFVDLLHWYQHDATVSTTLTIAQVVKLFAASQKGT